jgi:hypothetical protein
MHALLVATIGCEQEIAERDSEVAKVQKQYSPKIDRSMLLCNSIEEQLAVYYRANRQKLEVDGQKSACLTNGILGMRSPSNPALIPLDAKWNWEKICKKLKSTWKLRYFHKPKPPKPDLVKIKRELSAEELARCGMRLDNSETFFVELNRLAEPQRENAA